MVTSHYHTERKNVTNQLCYQVLSFKIRTYCIGTNNEHVQIKQTAVTRFKQWAQGGKARLIFNLGSHQIYTSPNKFMWSLFHYFMCHFPFEPQNEKTGFQGFRPGPTQIGLYSYRRRLDSQNFGFKKRNCRICVAKTKALISCTVTAQLICLCFL